MSLGLAGSAHAVPINYEVTGVIGEVNDPNDVLGDAFPLGMPFTGTVRYDTSIPDVSPNPEHGRYEAYPMEGLIRLSMAVGGIELTTNPAGNGQVSLNSYASGGDSIHIASGAVDSTGPWAISILEFFVYNEASTKVLFDDSLPADLDLADWPTNHTLGFAASGRSGFAIVFGEIQTLTLVPEPSTALLLTVGALAALRASRKREVGTARSASAN